MTKVWMEAHQGAPPQRRERAQRHTDDQSAVGHHDAGLRRLRPTCASAVTQPSRVDAVGGLSRLQDKTERHRVGGLQGCKAREGEGEGACVIVSGRPSRLRWSLPRPPPRHAHPSIGCTSDCPSGARIGNPVQMMPRGRGDSHMSLPRIAVAGAVALASLTGTLSLATLSVAESPSAGRLPACVSSGPVGGLTAVQARNARTVVAIASERGGERAALISIMVALAESGLRVLANPNDPSGAAYANEGVGYDHDSLGIFQQRPSWGTAAQRMSPTESTHLFLDALLKVRGWENLTPWYAAQLVQRSAFTGVPTAGNRGSTMAGENYWRQAERAAGIVTAVQGSSVALDCGGDGPPVVEQVAGGRLGLPQGYAIPAGTSVPAQTAVTFALAQLGKPYLWGGEGPDAYDCSGLMQTAWARAGVPIGRVVGQQMFNGVPTTLDALRPGDMVMIPGALGTMAHPGHVGMYIGYGLLVVAPKTGDVVRVRRLEPFVSKGLAGLRHIA